MQCPLGTNRCVSRCLSESWESEYIGLSSPSGGVNPAILQGCSLFDFEGELPPCVLVSHIKRYLNSKITSFMMKFAQLVQAYIVLRKLYGIQYTNVRHNDLHAIFLYVHQNLHLRFGKTFANYV